MRGSREGGRGKAGKKEVGKMGRWGKSETEGWGEVEHRRGVWCGRQGRLGDWERESGGWGDGERGNLSISVLGL